MNTLNHYFRNLQYQESDCTKAKFNCVCYQDETVLLSCTYRKSSCYVFATD